MRSALRRVLVLSLFFLLVVNVTLAEEKSSDTGSAPSAQGHPHLVLSEASYNFGSVFQGTPVTHDFVIKNSGTSELSIDRVHPACGCTAALLQAQKIPSGGETVLKTTFDTNGFYGKKVKTIRLYTNDPQQATVVLTLQGEVRRDIDVDPPRLYFGRIAKGTHNSLSVKIRVADDSGASIVKVSTRNPALSLETKKISDKEADVTVSLQENLPLGIIRDRLIIQTTSKRNPIVHVPIFARVSGDLDLSPADLSFGLVEGPLKEPKEMTAKLVNSGEESVSVEKVESDNAALSVSFQTEESGRVYSIRVQLNPGFEGILRGKVTITTSHSDPDQKTLELPVYGIVSKKGA